MNVAIEAPPRPKIEHFLVIINDGLTWSEMIKVASQDFVSPEIAPQHFAGEIFRSRIKGERVMEIAVVDFDRPMTLHNLRHELKEMYLRAAEFPEGLALASPKNFPDLQRGHPIVLAGTFWKNRGGDQGVAFLWSHLGKRTLGVQKTTDFEKNLRAFQPFCRFAAVPLPDNQLLTKGGN